MEAVREGTCERRAETRHTVTADVVIEVYDSEGKLSASEASVTENISHRGMCVVTELDLARGRYVRIRSAHYQIAVFAAVRRLRRGADGLKRLHLEFVDRRWPALDES